jgi:hypothetical protein
MALMAVKMLFALLMKTKQMGFACFPEITNYKNYFVNTPTESRLLLYSI